MSTYDRGAVETVLKKLKGPGTASGLCLACNFGGKESLGNQ
jgi:hypothetical protein